jgi:hypothetical protein
VTQIFEPWLCLGLTALPLLMACGAEGNPAGPATSLDTGGGAASLAGNGAGDAASVTGGAMTSAGGSAPSGGTFSVTGGTSSGGSSTGSGSGGGTATGGGTNTGGIEATAGGTAGTTGGASTGGTAETTGGTADTGGAQSSTGGSAGTPGSGGTSATGGNEGSGGTSGGETICGTAAEGDSVTLTCPEGRIIDSVLYASYGTPTGECGSFVTGDCHAATSETMVASLCVGRSSCTLTASNSTFGDPCNSVVKNLAVEVSCVVGEPTVGTGDPFKGVANSPAGEIEALGATWCYNWGTSPQATDCNDPYFVPMVWGGGDVAGAIQQISNAGYTTVLGFNEPNKTDQANMTVQEAIALWPDMTSNPNLRVGSPAVSDDGRAWLEEFMAQVQANGLRVDFIAMHWYGWNAGSCVASQLEGAINWAQQWSLPIWITEWGCMGSSNSDEQTVLNFFQDAVVMIETHPLVERYAWYPWNTYNHLFLEGVITPLGEAFAAAPQYR